MSMAWIGVDLDGTLAEYHGYVPDQIGKPIPAMVARVQQWISEGRRVKIFTARACMLQRDRMEIIRTIQDWCEIHIGCRLEVTAEKDYYMTEFWDDRCVPVKFNTGEIGFDPTYHEAAHAQDIFK